MIVVEIYTLRPEGDVTAGLVMLTDDNKVMSVPLDERYERLMQNMVTYPVVLADHRKLWAYENPVEWVNNLYREFHGIALRASEPVTFVVS
jgi:hypothetical protein